jgi:type II secretory pathway predicted ATPase ExeA
MLPPEERLVGAQLHRYLRDQLYWVLHAPRQTGKTTFLQSWMREINQGKEFVAIYVSVEDCQRITDVEEAMRIIDFNIKAAFYDAGFKEKIQNTTDDKLIIVADTLREMAKEVAPRKLTVLFDEVDVLEGNPLIRFLRLLRGGFATRDTGIFPVSIALVGMRDLKDYITQAKDGVAPNPGSPFNIKADSAVLSNFTQEDIAHLFAQRTAETGQHITDEALEYIWQQSNGQPWLVNNLFMRATMHILDNEDYQTVTLEHIKEARQQMIYARETHLDSLQVRLRDSKIKHVIQTILTGETDPDMGRMNPNVEFAVDLGLIRWESESGWIISNPIYEEILVRYLNSGYHDNTPPPSTWKWQKEDGSLDMDSLLKEFQRFWRKNADIWEEKSDYTEAFPHLLLMAFLQRIMNGTGDIDREVAAGSGRMDLYIKHKEYRCIIEVKIRHYYESYESVLEEGLEQIKKYRDTIDKTIPAYLIIFDRRQIEKRATWDERITWKEMPDGITIVGG